MARTASQRLAGRTPRHKPSQGRYRTRELVPVKSLVDRAVQVRLDLGNP